MDYHYFWVCFLFWLTFDLGAYAQRRRVTQCRYRGIYYTTGQRFSFQVQNKRFDCTCRSSGRLDCPWTFVAPPQGSTCIDKASGERKREGERWERVENGKTFDCSCKRRSRAMETVCSDENRCHHDGISHERGAVFRTATISGREMTCTCLPQKKISCRYEVEIPGPEVDSQWVENYIVYGGKVLRPQITTLQACRAGAKVVTSGVVWNQTKTNPLGKRIQEECTCLNAIIRCKTLRILDQVEPHCLSIDGRIRGVGERWLKVRERFPSQQFECSCRAHDDVNCRRVRRPRCIDDVLGTIRVAGEKWIRVHETLENLRFECTCHTNREMSCKDISQCDEPSVPQNGAMLCALVGKHGPGQVTYCKPMCLADYEFVNQQRYYRLWEVCGAMNLHRWSGGYVDDPHAIARCRAREGSYRRGHSYLYLPSNDCEGLTAEQREELKATFLRQLHHRNVCGNKCEVTLMKCGVKT